MRSSVQFALLAMVLTAVPAFAQKDPPPPINGNPPAKTEPKLKIGDPAPPLTVGKWHQGPEVKAFEKDKVYVVEFWATWCGPCIAAMPHLSALQAEYKTQGVTVVGFTSRDVLGKPDHSEQEVAAFMDRRGKKFGYSFAYADDNVTAEAWMVAAGREGIPCTFVVDKAGKIAYIGHPMYLPEVLPRVVDGAATAKEVGAHMAAVQAEFSALSANAFDDPKACLKALAKFETEHPKLADFLVSVRLKLSLLPKHGGPGEAKAYAEGLVAAAVKRKDVQTLGMTSALLRKGDGKGSVDLLAVAVRAAEAQVSLDGGKDAWSLLDLADAHFVSGAKAKAEEYARKAKDAASTEPAAVRESVEKEAARLGVK
ncbi:MAG: TlpA disulfide reductase family protein [Armatimonadaceae bacterium]